MPDGTPLGQGGIICAVARVKERKREAAANERAAAANRVPRQRPGQINGHSDGTLGIKEIASALAPYNNGNQTNWFIQELYHTGTRC